MCTKVCCHTKCHEVHLSKPFISLILNNLEVQFFLFLYMLLRVEVHYKCTFNIQFSTLKFHKGY